MHAGIRPAVGLFTTWAECLNLPGRYVAQRVKVQQIFEFTDSSRRLGITDMVFAAVEILFGLGSLGIRNAGAIVRIRTPMFRICCQSPPNHLSDSHK
jgi:hypothetical protein